VILPKIFIEILSSNAFSNKIYLPPKDVPGLTGNSQQAHSTFYSVYYCELMLFSCFQCPTLLIPEGTLIILLASTIAQTQRWMFNF